MRTTIGRALAFLLLWLAVAGRKPADLPIGVAVAVGSAWASFVLAPPSGGRVNLRAALIYFLDFLRLSLWSGLDVARRALSATPDLRPGVVEARLRLAPGRLPGLTLWPRRAGQHDLLPGELGLVEVGVQAARGK